MAKTSALREAFDWLDKLRKDVAGRVQEPARQVVQSLPGIVGKAAANTIPPFNLIKQTANTINTLNKTIPGGWQGGVERVKSKLTTDPLYFTPLSMRERVVPYTKTIGTAINQPQLGEDVGYRLRGALGITPFQRPAALGGNLAATTPTTQRQQTAERLGRSLYGMAATYPIGGLTGIASRGVSGAALGFGLGTVGNVLQGKPIQENLGENVLSGVENSWQLAFTNLATDKLLGMAGLNRLTSDQTGNAFKLLANASRMGLGKQTATKLFVRGATTLLFRALAESPVENTWFTAMDKVSGKEKENFLNAWIRNLPGTVVGNLIYAGAETGVRGSISFKQKQVDQAIEALKKTFKDQRGSISFGAEIELGKKQQISTLLRRLRGLQIKWQEETDPVARKEYARQYNLLQNQYVEATKGTGFENEKQLFYKGGELAQETKPDVGEGSLYDISGKGKVTLYRADTGGEGRYFSTSKDFSKEFTQTGKASEVGKITMNVKDIYQPDVLPKATNVEQMNQVIREAQQKGFKAIFVDEGTGLPNSVFNIEGYKVPKVTNELQKLIEANNTYKKMTGQDSKIIMKKIQALQPNVAQLPKGDIGGTKPPPTAPPSQPPTDPVQKIMLALKKAKPLRTKQENLYSQARAQKVAIAESYKAKGLTGEELYKAQLGALKGELPKQSLEELQVNKEDVIALYNKIEEIPFFGFFDKINTKEALTKLIKGEVPQKNELSLLGEAFGGDFVKEILNKRSLFQKVMAEGGAAANIPRQLMATGDFSAPLRQGIFLIPRHPVLAAKAFKSMFTQWASEKGWQQDFDSIRAHPNYKAAREAGVSIMDKNNPIAQQEEAWISKLPQRLPVAGWLIKSSERAYTGFLNRFRFDVFNSLYEQAKKSGVADDPKFIKDLGDFTNTATGRGNIKGLERSMGPLVTALFSPRLIMSRLQLLNIGYYAKLHPTVRKEAIKSLLSFAGTWLTVLTLAKMAGAEVSTDLRSADALKIKVGDTRFDVGGGFQQYLRAAVQLVSGQKISTTTGKLMTTGEGYKALSRKDILMQFAESKQSPIFSFINAILTQQTPVGGKVNIGEEALQRLYPLVWQDTVDAMKEYGAVGALTAIPATFGVGTQTYVTPPFDINKMYEVPIYTLQDQLEKMPKEQANEIGRRIKKERPDKYAALQRAITYDKLQLDPFERGLIDKGVANGARAKAIFDKLNKMETKEEKNTYVKKLREAKIITDQVFEQLKKLIKE